MKETDVVFGAADNKPGQVARLAWGFPSVPYGIILGHGASGTLDSGHLPQIAQAFADAGIWCLRYNSKSALKGRVACCEALLQRALELQREGSIPVRRWVQAGHSMGGRVASAVAHAQPAQTLGCIFFSYPLHPPGKQDQLRDDPLTSLEAPLLFIRGTNDAFCEGKHFEAILKRMTSPRVEVHEVPGGDHSLKVMGGKKAVDEAVAAACSAAVAFVQKLGEADTAGVSASKGAEAEAQPATEKVAAQATETDIPQKQKKRRKFKAQPATEKDAAQATETDLPQKQNKRGKPARNQTASDGGTKKRARRSAQ